MCEIIIAFLMVLLPGIIGMIIYGNGKPTPKFKGKIKLEIKYHRQNRTSIFIENNADSKEEKFAELLLFSRFTINSLIDMKNGKYIGGENISESIAKILSNIKRSTHYLTDAETSDSIRLIDHPKTEAKKKFIVNLKYNEKSIIDYNYIYKGFKDFLTCREKNLIKYWSFLNKPKDFLAYYFANSIILLMKYLYNKRENDIEYITSLKNIATQCGVIFPTKKFTTLDKNQLSLDIVFKNCNYQK